jgi:hypothetical protein
MVSSSMQIVFADEIKANVVEVHGADLLNGLLWAPPDLDLDQIVSCRMEAQLRRWERSDSHRLLDTPLGPCGFLWQVTLESPEPVPRVDVEDGTDADAVQADFSYLHVAVFAPRQDGLDAVLARLTRLEWTDVASNGYL